MHRSGSWMLAAAAALVVAASAADARAQLNTQHIKGTVGLESGSQHKLPGS